MALNTDVIICIIVNVLRVPCVPLFRMVLIAKKVLNIWRIFWNHFQLLKVSSLIYRFDSFYYSCFARFHAFCIETFIFHASNKSKRQEMYIVYNLTTHIQKHHCEFRRIHAYCAYVQICTFIFSSCHVNSLSRNLILSLLLRWLFYTFLRFFPYLFCSFRSVSLFSLIGSKQKPNIQRMKEMKKKRWRAFYPSHHLLTFRQSETQHKNEKKNAEKISL